MKISEIAEIIEQYAPRETALAFDNVGLLVGDGDNTVSKICVALDVTKSSLEYCVNCGANMLITHHPVIFDPIKSVVADDYRCNLILKAIQQGVSIYAAHTNMDDSPIGINRTLAERFGLHNVIRLSDDGGVIGEIDSDITGLKDCILSVTGDRNARVHAVTDKVKKVAIISGAGGRDYNLPNLLQSLGVDTYVSGEFKYKIVLDLIDKGINVVELGHYESERIFIDIVYDLLVKKHNIGVEVCRYTEPPCKLI